MTLYFSFYWHCFAHGEMPQPIFAKTLKVYIRKRHFGYKLLLESISAVETDESFYESCA
jgi:hypothetical protein